MDVLEKVAGRYCNELLPYIKWELEWAYLISMVQLSINSVDREWHKQNIFLSYLRALLFARGPDIILALCTGESPIAVITCNELMWKAAAVWWLSLFIPYDIFNKILNIELGDVKPLIILLKILTSLRCLAAVEAGVAASLKANPGCYIAVFIGTLAGNGSFAVAGVFGDFAKSVSTPRITKLAFCDAILFTLVQTCCTGYVSSCLVHAVCAAYYIAAEIMEAFGHKVECVDPMYEVIRKIVVLCDLVK